MIKNNKYLSPFTSPLSPQRGFTLIELLVVISVIAILTTLLMVNFVGIRQRGRDGQRKSNLYNIQSALELYRADVGLYLPNQGSFPGCGTPLQNGGNVYMAEVPCDPLTNQGYIYTSEDGSAYTLVACLENANDADKDETTDSNCTTASFTLTNP